MKISNAILANEMLTNIAHGYKHNESVGQFLMPTVTVSKETGKVSKFGKESFTLYSLERAIGAKLNEIPAFGAGTADYSLTEYEAKIELDRRLIEQGKDWIDLQAKAVSDLMKALAVSKEYKIAELAQSTASYASTNHTTLSSGYLNDASVDPIDFLLSKKQVISNLIGVEANTMILGKRVWDKFVRHAKIKAYFGSTNEQMVTLEKVKELLELDTLAVGKAVYRPENNASTTQIWGNNIILSYTAPIQEGLNRTEYDPAFGFLLQKEGGVVVQSAPGEMNKFEIIEGSEVYQPLVLGNESAYLIKTAIDPSVY